MSTQAQIAANQANAQLSTGPTSEAGRAAAARNNFRHGLTTSSEFWVLPCESQTDYLKLLAQFQQEHQPETPTEEALVQALAEHHWLRHRVMRLEEACFDYTTGQIIDDRKLALPDHARARLPQSTERSNLRRLSDIAQECVRQRSTFHNQVIRHLEHAGNAVSANIDEILIPLIGDHPFQSDVAVLHDDVNRRERAMAVAIADLRIAVNGAVDSQSDTVILRRKR